MALPQAAAGQPRPVRIPTSRVQIIEPGEAAIARDLAVAVAAVRERFERSRRHLPRGEEGRGARTYPRGDVTELLDRTAVDLDQALREAGKGSLDALRDWAAVEIESIRGELGEAESPSNVRFRARWPLPRPMARLASLAPWDRLARESEAWAFAGPSMPPPLANGISREKADGALDRVGAVLKGIFVLARKDDLQVKVKLRLDPDSAGDLVLFPGKHLCEEDAKRFLVRGDNPPIWRGLYRFETLRATLPYVPCPRDPRDWPPHWTLDLVTRGGKVSCDFERSRNRNPCDPPGKGR